MRITGGQARGIAIVTGKARHIRPATDRMREAVFSSLGSRIAGGRFLDLFAGSGSYGLEAVSRGAGGGLFVEKHPQAVEVLQENIRHVLKSMGNPPSLILKVIRRDVLRFSTEARFPIIFMDPPYDLARSQGSLLLDKARAWLGPDGILVYELPGDLALSDRDWNCRRRIGKSGINEPSIALLEPRA